MKPIDNDVAFEHQGGLLFVKKGGEALQKVNMLPISDRFKLNGMKRVLDGAYMKDIEEDLKIIRCVAKSRTEGSLWKTG